MPLIGVRVPAAFRHTYTCPVATTLSRANFGLAFFFFLVVAPAAAPLFDDVCDCVVAGVVELPVEPPPRSSPPPLSPRKYSAATSPTMTTATSQPRPNDARGGRRRSRCPGGAIGCSS